MLWSSSTIRGSLGPGDGRGDQAWARAKAAAPASSRSTIRSQATASANRASSSAGVSYSSQAGFSAAITPLTVIGADVVDQRLADRLAGVVGVDALHEALVDRRGRVLAAGQRRAVPRQTRPKLA